MKHLKRINELDTNHLDTNLTFSYEEALDKMCKFIVEQIYLNSDPSQYWGKSVFGSRWHSFIGSLKTLYDKPFEKVQKDIDDIIEEYRIGKRKLD